MLYMAKCVPPQKKAVHSTGSAPLYDVILIGPGLNLCVCVGSQSGVITGMAQLAERDFLNLAHPLTG